MLSTLLTYTYLPHRVLNCFALEQSSFIHRNQLYSTLFSYFPQFILCFISLWIFPSASILSIPASRLSSNPRPRTVSGPGQRGRIGTTPRHRRVSGPGQRGRIGTTPRHRRVSGPGQRVEDADRLSPGGATAGSAEPESR